MNYDNKEMMRMIDQDNFLQRIRTLDENFTKAWEFVSAQAPIHNKSITNIIFVGFTECRNVLNIFELHVETYCDVPIIINDENTLPKWCKGKENLIIGLVTSSNVDKMEKIFQHASNQQCSIFSLLLNANFEAKLHGYSIDSWVLPEYSFSRTTVAYDVMVLYGLFHKLGLVPDMSNDFPELLNSIQQTINHIDIDIPSAENPAKRLAGQMIGRWIKIVGGGIMKPVAQRWSNQINESAKTLAFAEDINQSAHHSLSGIYNPENITNQSMVIFLKSRFNNEDIEGLIDIAKEEYMCNGIGTDFYVARGETRLSQIWSTILFGDFVAYYLAMAYECDPTPTAKLN